MEAWRYDPEVEDEIHLWEDTNGNWMVSESDLRPVSVTRVVALEIADRLMLAKHINRLVIHESDGRTLVAEGNQEDDELHELG